jgi:hypothetical protein
MNYDRYPGGRQRDIAHICDAYWDEVVCLEGISLAILFFCMNLLSPCSGCLEAAFYRQDVKIS